MRDDSAGILIFEKGGGGYVVILQPPKGENVEVFIAGGDDNSLYRMEKTTETATMETFTGLGNVGPGKPSRARADDKSLAKPRFEVVVNNDE